MSEERNAVRFRQAAALSPHLRRPERLDGTSQARVEELRLRAGRPTDSGLPGVSGRFLVRRRRCVPWI